MTIPSLVAQVVLLGEERELLEELLDGALLGGRVVLARHAHELLEVLEPALRLDRALGLERLGVAGLLERLGQQVAHAGAALGALAQALHHRHEAPHRLDRRRRQARHRLGLGGHVPDRLADRVRVADEPPLRGGADAAPRRVHDAAEGHRVGRVHEQREVGERVLDLGALVEARAADDLVADAVAHQHVLEHAALRVGPVEDGDLVARGALVDEPLDLGHHEARLGVLVLELAHVDRIALAELRPEELVLALPVVRDDRVRRVEDRLRRAVVLLELDDRGIRVVPLEAEDVLDVGAPEGVDRVVGDQAVGDEVVGVLDVEVVDRRVESHTLDCLHEVEGPVLREHDHPGPDIGGRVNGSEPAPSRATCRTGTAPAASSEFTCARASP